ncbi:hypothetical protein ACQ4M4_13500 [Leptolyngbya sp. AN02str]|uniref:hypothetical protein n=1 Tax=Leptolyngbya sp. AN02str TaxID=3423363 RepID=UPI003D31107A
MEPITAGVIMGLIVTKFVEGAVGKGAEKLTEDLWSAIKKQFKGREPAEKAIATVEAAPNPAIAKAEADKLTKVLDAEMVMDDKFAAEVQQMAQQILNLDQSQRQEQVIMNQQNYDQAKGYQIKADRIDRIGDDYSK